MKLSINETLATDPSGKTSRDKLIVLQDDDGTIVDAEHPIIVQFTRGVRDGLGIVTWRDSDGFAHDGVLKKITSSEPLLAKISAPIKSKEVFTDQSLSADK